MTPTSKDQFWHAVYHMGRRSSEGGICSTKDRNPEGIATLKLPKTVAKKLYWTNQSLQGNQEIRQRYETLMASQWMTPDEIRDLQFQKLSTLVAHAYENVPYYREVMQHRGLSPSNFTSFEDLQKLPRLTRTILLERQSDLVAKNVDPDHYHKAYSSGSTGIRAEFLHDREFFLWMQAHQLRTYQWCGGWTLGDPFVTIMGSLQYWRGRPAGGIITRMLSNRRELYAYRLGVSEQEQLLNFIVRFKPKLISGYTTALYLIARLAAQRGVEFPFLGGVQTTAEPLPPEMRVHMEEAYGCKVYDKYGSRETTIVSHDSPNHEHLCIQGGECIRGIHQQQR